MVVAIFFLCILVFGILLIPYTEVVTVINQPVEPTITYNSKTNKLEGELSNSGVESVDLLTYNNEIYIKPYDLSTSYADEEISRYEVHYKAGSVSDHLTNKAKIYETDVYLIKYTTELDNLKENQKIVKDLKKFNSEEYRLAKCE